MGIGVGVIALSESFRDMATGVQVLDALEGQFRSFGATHFLATGFPLPGRPLEPLILRTNWGDLRGDRSSGHGIKTDDPLLQLALRAHRPFTWFDAPENPMSSESLLLTELGSPKQARVIAVPICVFLPYQAVVIAGGRALSIDTKTLLSIDHLCVEAFRRLFALGFLRPERPGELSARERRVVELSASGKTARPSPSPPPLRPRAALRGGSRRRRREDR